MKVDSKYSFTKEENKIRKREKCNAYKNFNNYKGYCVTKMDEKLIKRMRR